MRNRSIFRDKKTIPPPLVWVLGLFVLVLSTCTIVKTEGIVDEDIPDDVDPPIHTQLQLRSRVFENGGYLPNQYYSIGFSEDAENLAPPLEWSQVSEEAKSLLLFMYDHGVPDQHHWLIYGIPRTSQGIFDGFSLQNYLNASSLAGGAVAIKGGTDKGYRGPSPIGIHTYTVLLVELQDEAIALSSDDRSRTVSDTDQSQLGKALIEFIDQGATALEYNGTRYPVLGSQSLTFKASLAYPEFESLSSIVGKDGEKTVTITFKEELGRVERGKISVLMGDGRETNQITSASSDGKVLTLALTDTLRLGDPIEVSFDVGAVADRVSELSNQVRLTIQTQIIGFTLSIAGMEEGDELPAAHRSDGDAQSPLLYWAYPPTNTKSFVLLLYHNDIDVSSSYYGDGEHIWLLYNIPPTLSSLAQNVNPRDYGIGVMQGGNQYGYRPPILDRGSKQYRLVLVALDRMIRPEHVDTDDPISLFSDNDRTSDTESLARLAYATIDYLEGESTALGYDGGFPPDPYTVLGTASFDMTISYHASPDGPKIDMGYYSFLLNNRNAGPFMVLDGYNNSIQNNQIWLGFDEVITLVDPSKFIIKKGSDSGNRQVVAITVSPEDPDDDNQGVDIALGTTNSPILIEPFDMFEITIQAGAVKNKGDYFNQDISLDYTVQVPKIIDTNNYYLDVANNKLGILFEFPIMAPYFVIDYIFNKGLFTLQTGPAGNRSTNTITSITANGSVLELGYTSAINLNDEIHLSIEENAIVDEEVGYPNYAPLTFFTTATTPDSTYPVLETNTTIQSDALGIENNIYVDLASGSIRVLFDQSIALVDAADIRVQSKLPNIDAYKDLPFRTDRPIEIIGTNTNIISIHLAEAISDDVPQLKVKINASAVQSTRSGVKNYYIVVDHDVHVPQLIKVNPLAVSTATKTVSLSFKRNVDLVDRTKVSASIGGDPPTQLSIVSNSFKIVGEHRDVLQFELPVSPSVGEVLTVTLAAGAIKDSVTHYQNTVIEVSKEQEGGLPVLDHTFRAHLYSLPLAVDIPHKNRYIYLVFDTEEDLEVIETGFNSPYHLPYSLISIRKGMDKQNLQSVELLRDPERDSIAIQLIPDKTPLTSSSKETSERRMLTLMVEDTFDINGEHVEIVIEPGVVRNSVGANEKIILHTQIVVPSVKRITAEKDSTSITMEFNREVIYVGPCLSLTEIIFTLFQSEPAEYTIETPAPESIVSIYDDNYEDTSTPNCNYNATSITGQRFIDVYRVDRSVYPDFQISEDHKTITLRLSAPITESSLPLSIGNFGIADRYSRQAMNLTRYTVTPQ